jgi:hypothetical protein
MIDPHLGHCRPDGPYVTRIALRQTQDARLDARSGA